MKQIRYYNVLFPIWLLVFIPSPLWLILIPLNYAIDYYVLKYCFHRYAIEGISIHAHNWAVCLLGFLSDLIGSILLFGIYLSLPQEGIFAVTYGLGFNPFHDSISFLITTFCIIVAGLCIYGFQILYWKKKIGMEKAKKIALWMAVLTAPYLYYFPMEWIY